MDMKHIWKACKDYFGDGFVPNSNPIQFNTHWCDLKRRSTGSENSFYGVEINEDTMPLFSALGDTSAPSCSCYDVQKLCKHMDDYIEKMPNNHADDYSLHTGKGDTTVEEACTYALRDTIHWWSFWHGSLDGHYWKILYIALSTVPDDCMIPPQDVLDGSFRFLGHTYQEILDGLHAEKVDPDDIKFVDLCLWRQLVLQYLEKVDDGIRPLLVSKTTLMTQFRVITGGVHATAALLLAARGVKSQGIADSAMELSGTAIAISLDMAKEVLGVLKGETTETVAGNREQLKKELRWLYVRNLEALDSLPTAPLLRRYATSSLHFVFLMDRYRERLNNSRFPISGPLRSELDQYIKRDISSVGA